MTRVRYFDPYSGIDSPANEPRRIDLIDVAAVLDVIGILLWLAWAVS